ncbi:MAG: prolipoprotein diacylglyceryl transferase [Bacteroidetes bacterium]|nr:prolipoprotein diacylglyceryl transferase [Bacteroidota bacterium]
MHTVYITWDIDPTIIDIGGFQLRWYGVLFAASFFFGYLLLDRMFRREEQDKKLLDKLILYMGIGTLTGARLGHCFLYQPYYYMQHPFEILMLWKGGLASHGSAIGILAALLVFSLIEKINYLWILDRMIVAVALSGVMIRLGNFTNSELLGKPTEVPWAFVFPKVDMVPRHPAQLYEALAYLIVLGLLLWLYYKRNTGSIKGLLFGIFLITIFGFRIFIEIYKEVQVKEEEHLLMNFGQLYSIPFVIAGIVLIIISLARKRAVK